MATDTAKRLTDAVLLSMREHGYAGMSMQNLLRATSVSSSSMYHFFPGGKEELVASAVRRVGLEAAGQIAAVLQKHEFIKGVVLIFEAAAAEMKANDFRLGCPIGVPATEVVADSPLIQTAVADVLNAWAAAYEAALVEGGMRRAKARSLGRFIVATYEGTVTLARSTRSIQPYRDATTVFRNNLTFQLTTS